MAVSGFYCVPALNRKTTPGFRAIRDPLEPASIFPHS